MTITNSTTANKIWKLFEEVYDPEVPVLTVLDLGIIRNVEIQQTDEEEKVIVTITPTYSGCPAMDVISMNIRMALLQHGYKNFEIKNVLSPAWTTDWMSDEGRKKLKAYGIAPPQATNAVCTPDAFAEEEAVQCPQCNSYNTVMISKFGSTACKALYKCSDCREPFDYFKCH